MGGDWTWPPQFPPLGMGLDLIPLNFPLGCGPGPDPPQFPPLGVGLDLIPLNFPLGCGPGPPLDRAPGSRHPPDQAPPRTEFLTHACENITLPQTSFAGGNKTAETRPQNMASFNQSLEPAKRKLCRGDRNYTREWWFIHTNRNSLWFIQILTETDIENSLPVNVSLRDPFVGLGQEWFEFGVNSSQSQCL